MTSVGNHFFTNPQTLSSSSFNNTSFSFNKILLYAVTTEFDLTGLQKIFIHELF